MGHGDVVTDVLGRFDGIVVPGRTTEATAAVGEPPLDAVVRPLPTTPRGTPWWVRAYRSAAVTTDVVFAGATAWVCTSLRFNDEAGEAWNTAVTVAVTFLGWVVVLTFAHGYERSRFGSGTEEYRAVGLAALLGLSLVSLGSYVMHADLSRGLVLPLIALLFVGTLCTRCVLRAVLREHRHRGGASLATVVVGRADSVAQIIREISSARVSGYRVVGACVSHLEEVDARTDISGVPILGPPEAALAAVDRLGAEAVAVSSDPDLHGAPLRRLGWALAEREVELIVAPGIIDVAGPRLSLRPAAGLSLLHVERPVMRGGRVVVKRVVDTIAATAITVLALLPLAVIALLVRLDTAGPVFFRQERVGAKGTTFPMLKFRTMVLDAEDRLCDLASEPQVNEKLFKLPNDPRVTRVGAVLRRFSLDELLQLVNVLLGHMSLVGPRPPLLSEVATYEPDAVQRLRVRPGMTGLWQISGRSSLSWEDALRLDLWYVDNWSPLLDAHILMRTTRAVLGGRGAY